MRVCNFLLQCGGARAGVGRVAQHGGELIAQLDDVEIAALHGLGGDDVECVVNEVRADLRLQRAQLRLQCTLAHRQLVHGAAAQLDHHLVERMLQLEDLPVTAGGDLRVQKGEHILVVLKDTANLHLLHLFGQTTDGAGEQHGHQHDRCDARQQDEKGAAEHVLLDAAVQGAAHGGILPDEQVHLQVGEYRVLYLNLPLADLPVEYGAGGDALILIPPWL